MLFPLSLHRARPSLSPSFLLPLGVSAMDHGNEIEVEGAESLVSGLPTRLLGMGIDDVRQYYVARCCSESHFLANYLIVLHRLDQNGKDPRPEGTEGTEGGRLAAPIPHELMRQCNRR